MNHLLNAFTGKDNQTVDIGRVLWAATVVVFLALSVVATWHSRQFDGIAFGAGSAAVLAGGGLALRTKQGTEPEPGKPEGGAQ